MLLIRSIVIRRKAVGYLIVTATCLQIGFSLLFVLWHLLVTAGRKTSTYSQGMFVHQSLPLCTKSILDREGYDYDHHPNDNFVGMIPVLHQQYSCRLQHYTKANAVQCFDQLSSADDNKKRRGRLHFAFMGDSRIRQQYINFLKFLPAYANPWKEPLEIELFHDKHVNVTVPLLNGMVISFHWTTLTSGLLNIIGQWANDTAVSNDDIYYTTPYFLLIGSSVHHMTVWNGNDHGPFERGLIDLIPSFERLSRRGSRIVWMNQYPAEDFIYSRDIHMNFSIMSEKIENYNKIARRVLMRRKEVIQVWDSASPLVEEYVRSCSLLLRSTDHKLHTWMDCWDYLHPAYAALSQTSQLLMNYICNHEEEYGTNK